MSTSVVGVSPLLLAAVIVAIAAVTDSYGCPSGCKCQAMKEKGVMSKATCSKKWLREEPPVFPETIEKMEFRNLFYDDMVPYLSGAPNLLELVIHPSHRIGAKTILPDGFLDVQTGLQSLSIYPTTDFKIPRGTARAIEPLSDMKNLHFWDNRMRCNCALPDIMFRNDIKLKNMYRMPGVLNCKAFEGFTARYYKVYDFVKECARRGGYTLKRVGLITDRGNMDVGVRSRESRRRPAYRARARPRVRARARPRVRAPRRYGRAAGEDPLLAHEGMDDLSGNRTEGEAFASQNGMNQMDIADELDQETVDQQDEAENEQGDKDDQAAILENGSRRRHQSKPLTPEQMQLALYQLPTNDLTIRLNPYDPFEVDLFFQYVLHEKNRPKLNMIEKLEEL